MVAHRKGHGCGNCCALTAALPWNLPALPALFLGVSQKCSSCEQPKALELVSSALSVTDHAYNTLPNLGVRLLGALYQEQHLFDTLLQRT